MERAAAEALRLQTRTTDELKRKWMEMADVIGGAFNTLFADFRHR
jgi:hypothetical protein